MKQSPFVQQSIILKRNLTALKISLGVLGNYILMYLDMQKKM